ncbi:MAG: hypothetical protein P8Y51_01295 [Campylobacterales bacterium]
MSFLSYTESIDRLLTLDTGGVRIEKVPLPDALGRILDEHIVADEDYPRHPSSPPTRHRAPSHSPAATTRPAATPGKPSVPDWPSKPSRAPKCPKGPIR